MTHRLHWKILILATILVALQSNCFAEGSITWGVEDAGLRLGLTTDPANGTLRIVLHNISPTSLSVLVAMKSGNGITYGFMFTTTALNGPQHTIWDVRPKSMAPVAGFVAPEVVSLAPGTKSRICLSAEASCLYG
jgi:hypothetical protein